MLGCDGEFECVTVMMNECDSGLLFVCFVYMLEWSLDVEGG